MPSVKPYVSFKGNCADAVKFYIDALGAELVFSQKYGDSPMKGKAPDDKIMHCTLRVGDTHVMACDSMFPDHPVNVGNNISLAIGADDPAAADGMFDRLSQGGTVTLPMQETFWARRFGMLIDRFGINWMINVDKPASAHAKATTHAAR